MPEKSRARGSVSRRRWWRWGARAASLVLLALGVWLILVPQWRDAVVVVPEFAGRVPPAVLVLAVVAESASLVCFSAMTRTMAGRALPFGTALRIDLADLAINHTVPGGGGVAAGARFGMLVRQGLDPSRAFALASVETVLSNVALAGVFAGGVLLALDAALSDAEVWAAVLVAALALAAVGASVLLVRKSTWLSAWAERAEAAAPFLRRLHLAAVIRDTRRQLLVLRETPGRIALCAALAAANWLLDACALWLILVALGGSVAVGPLLASYGLATILAQLPITPGGLGVVEGVLVPTLVAVGVPPRIALLGVLGWRVLQYWLPIPVGGLAAASLRWGRGHARRGQASAG